MTNALAIIMAALEGNADCPLIERRGTWLTGTELLWRIRARAADLRNAGLQPGGGALIIVSDNLVAIETLLGCWMLGASGCFVDFRTPPKRLEEWVEHLSPNIVTGKRPVSGVAVHVQAPDPTYDATDTIPLNVGSDDVAIYFASSGTTGFPKLLPRTHSWINKRLRQALEKPKEGAQRCALSAISVAYSASSFLWLQQMAVAQPVIALDLLFRLDELDDALKRDDVTECSLPPTLIRRLAALPGEGLRYPQLLKLGSVGGPALAKDKIAAVTRLSSNYLMTYSCVGIGLIARISGDEILEKPASCGKVIEDVRVSILDGSRICYPNEVGEILVTNETVEDARPGDLGWLDEDGYLYITGRVQGLFCKNGVNFSADRLTTAALAIPEVLEAAAISQPDADGGDTVHLFVQNEGQSADMIAQRIKQALPSAEQPDHIHVRTDLPLSPAGKVDLQWLAVELDKNQRGTA